MYNTYYVLYNTYYCIMYYATLGISVLLYGTCILYTYFTFTHRLRYLYV